MNIISSIRGRVARKLQGLPSPFPSILTDAEYQRVRLLPPFTPGEVSMLGRTVAFSDIDGFLHSIREIFVDEVYRFDYRAASPRIIDAGANIGLSVLYFKQLFPGATVVAYEPDPQMFALLQRNTADLAGIDLHNAAAWTADVDLTFYTEGSLAGSSEIDFLDQGRVVTVRAERLRDELARAPVDFLKIDIEGAENDVLFDLADELDRIDLVFFEYHSVKGKPQRLGAMLEMMTSKGFRYAVNGCHTAARPFVETMPKGFDLQLNVSCFR